MLRKIARAMALCGFVSAALTPSSAFADDGTTTGIVAGLGITAATGKSTLAGGAGAIEASLLTAEALRQIGLGIRRLVDANVPEGAPIVLLSHTDTFDLSFARWLPVRMVQVLDQAHRSTRGVDCPNPRVTLQDPDPFARYADTSGKKFGFAPTDITAAIATDYSVSGISLTADDRVLINAIQLGRNGTTGWTNLNGLIDGSAVPRPDHFSHRFVVPGEVLDVHPEDSATLRKLSELQTWADTNRHCTAAAWKAAIDTVDKFVAGITASDKGAPAVLAVAELEPLLQAPANPHILRVTIEAIGGTAVSRSNIWYALGYPGAVTVSSGVVVSFRLFDPGRGVDEVVGSARCALKPTSLRDVRHVLITDSAGKGANGARAPELTCGYRLG